jgi:hypothetical protein
MTWVGERGPELVTLPRGSRISTNEKSMAMASGGGSGIQITIENVSMGSDMDVHETAMKLAREINKRMRG